MVLDTNVLISALLFGGHVDVLYGLITREVCTPCFTPSTLFEFSEVVRRGKFRNALERRGYQPNEVVGMVRDRSLLYPDIEIQNVIHEDPNDDKFLACALASRADFIVSGDRHLLELGSYEGIPIVAPAEFLRKIKT